MSDIAVIKKLKVVELKAALSARGLNTKGKKDELVKRLTEAMEADEEPKGEEQVQDKPESVEEATDENSAEDSQSQEEPPDETNEGETEEPKEAEGSSEQEETIESTEPDTSSVQEAENTVKKGSY